MIFSSKVQTVGSIKDFLGPIPAEKIKIASTAAILTGFSVGLINQIQPLAAPVMAIPGIGKKSIIERIIEACDPIIQLIQGISYPVAFIMICSGFLVIMTGNRQKGLNIIKWAALGYIGMQFAPAIMTILVEVGKAMLGK
jgi:hypothetical protein